jgi:stalled ribosome rescue protein Dom34
MLIKMNIRTIYKAITVLLILLLAGILTVVSFRNKLCLSLVRTWTTSATGLELSIEDLNIDLLHNTLSLRGITLQNPPGFENEALGKIKEIFVTYDLISSLRKRKPHFRLIKAYISEINIIKNEKGESNTVSFGKRNVQASSPTDTSNASQGAEKNKVRNDDKFLIDRLAVSLEKATFMDYTAKAGQPAVIIFTLEKPCLFRNVNHLAYVINSVSTKGGFREFLTPEKVLVNRDPE